MEGLQDMLKTLLEDRKKREEVIENERIRREDEIREERERREEERQRREREVKAQMEAMQLQVDTLIKLVEKSGAATTPKTSNELSVKLVPLTEHDDIEAYLVTFERIMEAHKIDRDRWSYYLAPQLTGKAQLAFAALPSLDSGKYDAIKSTILARYDINEEAYRRRFRNSQRKEGESNRELAVRLMDLQVKWLKDHKTVEAVREVIGLEQFLSTLPTSVKLWVAERKPKTCVQAGELADEYEQARRQDGSKPERLPVSKTSAEPSRCGSCGKPGHVDHECRSRGKNSTTGMGRPLSNIRCLKCNELGHIARRCPEKKALMCKQSEAEQSSLKRKGTVEGQNVDSILLDTGCSRTMVRQALVPQSKFLEGDAVTIKCAHGDTVLYPLAEVEMEVDGVHIKVEAAVSDTLPVAVLLGTDVPQLTQLLGEELKTPSEQADAMVVVTRARAKQQLEEEICRREKEALTGASSQPLEESGHSNQGKGTNHLTKEQQREIRQQFSRQQAAKESTKSVDQGRPSSLDVSTAELARLQEEDHTLAKANEAAEGCSGRPGTCFFKRSGLLYRKWKPPGFGEEAEVEQLALPRKCRKAVLEFAHEIPLAGHLGRDKTRQRILQRFYWPTIFQDVDNFCRSCVVCQKTSHQKVKQAPLIPLPIISEPFSRIAMDIVGPLPKSRKGNRYLLVICDYATRYPEAIPLRSIDAEHIAEELLVVFSRVGVPKEILTDQGSNFTSQLLTELYRLLHVHPIRTSPYHPQTDGLVERFNQTLKSMLRKVATSEGKDWDKMVPYLLFAYREVPQASTGFSPFELLYGRNVRGPLDVLRETWETNDRSSEESIISYVLLL